MSELDPALTAALDRLAPRSAAAPDWSEVLARAGARRRRVPLALAFAALLAAIAAVAAPALGLQGPLRGLLGIEKRPLLGFAATLDPVAGSGSGSFSARPLRTFTHVGSNRTAGFTRTVRWTLRFDGLSGPATSATLRVAPPRPGGGRERGYALRLCAPCSSGAHGRLRRRGLILALLAGRATVEVATASHPDGEVRGRVMAGR